METDRTILPNDLLRDKIAAYLAARYDEQPGMKDVRDAETILGMIADCQPAEQQHEGGDAHELESEHLRPKPGRQVTGPAEGGGLKVQSKTEACVHGVYVGGKCPICSQAKCHFHHCQPRRSNPNVCSTHDGTFDGREQCSETNEPIIQANDDSPERVRHVCGASGFMVGQDGINDVCPGCDFNKTSREDDEPLYSGSPCILECVQTQAGHGLECPRR